MTTNKEFELKPSLSQSVYSVEQVKDGEIKAAAALGLSLYDLMERAGKAAFDVIRHYYPSHKHWIILVGTGNNGGDAYVIARLAKAAGISVNLIAISEEKELKGDAAQSQKLFLDAGGELNLLPIEMPKSDGLVVDGLLGTGVSRVLDGFYEKAVQWVNRVECPVVSIDVPSGIHADTGCICGRAIEADLTITFIAIKLGVVTSSGRGHAGKLVFDDLGIRETFESMVTSRANLVRFDALLPLPARKDNIYKGACGKLLCIGSNKGMAGAIRLTGEAALRCGAGLVKVLCHESNINSVINGRPELMVSGDTSELVRLYEWADVVIVGPGLGRNEWARSLLGSLLSLSEKVPKPIVVDADALSMSDSFPKMAMLENCVMTPHAGEAARMLGKSATSIEENRYESACTLAEKYNATVVLKGAGTIVEGSSSTHICEDGNPGMATAGMGDLLCGIIGALIANGLSLDKATVYAVCIHSHAADIVASEKGPKGLLASDLFEPLRRLVNFDNAVSTNNKRRRTDWQASK